MTALAGFYGRWKPMRKNESQRSWRPRMSADNDGVTSSFPYQQN
jgi:hypothetical protein